MTSLTRSYDPEDLREATRPYPDIVSPTFDFSSWVANKKNILYKDDGGVGFLTYEYPGVYTGHWFFKARGKEALLLGREMLNKLFVEEGAEVVRGLTSVNLPAARWASRKLGFQSLGIVSYPDGDYELFYLTRHKFYSNEKDN